MRVAKISLNILQLKTLYSDKKLAIFLHSDIIASRKRLVPRRIFGGRREGIRSPSHPAYVLLIRTQGYMM